MISRLKFLSALKIVNDYKKQLKDELESINNNTAEIPNSIFINKDTSIQDINISIRLLNVLINNRDKLEIPGLSKDSPASALSNISYSKLLECKNIGDKTAKEFKEILKFLDIGNSR
jgi:hypothetical protein